MREEARATGSPTPFGVIVCGARGEQTAGRESRSPSQRRAVPNLLIEQLGRRCALVLLVSMTLAVTMGLLAWGPIPLGGQAHQYADERSWLGLRGAANVWVNLAMFAAGAWGWHVTRAGRWPAQLRMPWQLFHLCAMLSAVASGLYHADTGDLLFVLAHVFSAAGFVMLTLGMLAERVHSRFGTPLTCLLVLCGVATAGLVVLFGHSQPNGLDMRPLLLLEIVPVLVIPAGALSLPGRVTRASDWIGVLTFYALAKLMQSCDALVLEMSGWISGHTLMHLMLTAAVGRMAYCAALAGEAPAAVTASPAESEEQTQRDTSLKTAG